VFEYVGLSGELNGMSRKIALRRAHELLSQLGLEEARYRRLENYSAGMVQRIKLAATLVHDPDLLLLDEPTSGLDPDGRSAMLALLKSLAQRPGKSLLFSTHLLGDIEDVCQHAIIMEKGKVVASGALDSMLAGQANTFLIRWKNNNGSTDDGYLAALQQSGAEVSPSEEQQDSHHRYYHYYFSIELKRCSLDQQALNQVPLKPQLYLSPL
jgi:ABC-2 type transport system ATP-binding protein